MWKIFAVGTRGLTYRTYITHCKFVYNIWFFDNKLVMLARVTGLHGNRIYLKSKFSRMGGTCTSQKFSDFIVLWLWRWFDPSGVGPRTIRDFVDFPFLLLLFVNRTNTSIKVSRGQYRMGENGDSNEVDQSVPIFVLQIWLSFIIINTENFMFLNAWRKQGSVRKSLIHWFPIIFVTWFQYRLYTHIVRPQ